MGTRPLVNEWLWAHWCEFKARIYGMFRWKTVTVTYNERGQIWLVQCAGKIFYARGKT